jgi:hypothetical protein
MIRCSTRPSEFEFAIRWFSKRSLRVGPSGIRKPNTLRDFPALELLRHRAKSQSSTNVVSRTSTQTNLLRVLEIPVSKLKDEQNSGILYTHHSVNGETNSTTSAATNWTTQKVTTNKSPHGFSTTAKDDQFNFRKVSRDALALFLPAQFPKSVAPGYLGFASFCFSASIAGSAAMVLSTQTLLLAVGIVGQSVAQASIMAGAFNWVMKDFVGQLGGVLFASQMGKTRAFDSDPKRWRMVAAMALDGATLLEILSPLFPASLVLPVASVANIGKNIGFLTASASRAALHQSVAISGNLGDVTAKAGSQSIMASLIGTSLGIGLSSLLGHDTYNFAFGFLGLTIIHQGCNYLSLQYVPLAHFNRQRLLLVLEAYLSSSDDNEGGVVPSPAEVAGLERFFPLVPNVESSSKDWLRIGASLVEVCPDARQLERLLVLSSGESYLIRVHDEKDKYCHRIDLVYLEGGTGDDVIRGMYHACLLRQGLTSSSVTSMVADSDDLVRGTHDQVQKNFPHLLEQLHRVGWKTDSDVTTVESSTAFRLLVKRLT